MVGGVCSARYCFCHTYRSTKQRLCHISHLILLDTKIPRQIFNFEKCVFPFSNLDAVFTSRFLGSIMNCRTKSSILPFVVILSKSVRVFFHVA